MRNISQIIKKSNVLQYAIDNGMEYEDVKQIAKITLDIEDYSCIECGFNHNETNLLIILKNPESFNPNSDELTADKLTVVCENDMMENNVDTNKSNEDVDNEFESNEESYTINAEDEDIEIFIDEQDKSNEDEDNEFVVSSEDMKEGNFSTLNDIDFEEDERTDNDDYNEFEDESGFDDELDIGVPDEDKDRQVSNNDSINDEFEDDEFEDDEFYDDEFEDKLDIGVPDEDIPSKNNDDSDKLKKNNSNTQNKTKTNYNSKNNEIKNYKQNESFYSSFFYHFTLPENIWNILIFIFVFGGIIIFPRMTRLNIDDNPLPYILTETSAVFILIATVLFTMIWLTSRYDRFEPIEYADKYIYISIVTSLISIPILLFDILMITGQSRIFIFSFPAIIFITISAYTSNLVIKTDKTKLLEKELLSYTGNFDGDIDEKLKQVVNELEHPKALKFNSMLWISTINGLAYATVIAMNVEPSQNIVNTLILSLILISTPTIILFYMLFYRQSLFRNIN